MVVTHDQTQGVKASQQRIYSLTLLVVSTLVVPLQIVSQSYYWRNNSKH